jgi:ketosteroid isomerase-like protein
MSSQHRDVIAGRFAAVDDGDVERFLRGYADNVVYERPGYPAIVGRDALERFYRLERTVEHGRHTIEGLICEDGRGVAWGSFAGVSRTGDPLAERWCDVYLFEHDLIVFRRTHFYRPGV